MSPISIIRALREKLNRLSLPVLIWSLKYRDLLKPLEGSLFFGKEKKQFKLYNNLYTWNHTGKNQAGPLLQFSKIFHCLQRIPATGESDLSKVLKEIWQRWTLSHKHTLNYSSGLHCRLMGESNRIERG